MKKLPPIKEALAQLEASYQPEPIIPQSAPQELPPIEQALETIESPQVDMNSPIAPDGGYEISQGFGPSQYDYLSGGFNYGVDFKTPVGTPMVLPEDDWVVEEVYTGGGFNQGYGNTLVVRNERTGEKLRFEHLNDIDPSLAVGVKTKGGLVARSGSTGNVTGPHASIPYWNAQGQPADLLQSPYANIIPYKKPN